MENNETIAHFTRDEIANNYTARSQCIDDLCRLANLDDDVRGGVLELSYTTLAEFHQRLKEGEDTQELHNDIIDHVYTWTCRYCDEPQQINWHSYCTHEGFQLCKNCNDTQTTSCYNCGDVYMSDSDEIAYDEDDEENYCSNCRDDLSSSTRGLTPEQIEADKQYLKESQKFHISTKKHKAIRLGNPLDWGDIVKSSRGWSTEIEFYFTRLKDTYMAVKAMPEGFGISQDGSLQTSGFTPDGVRIRQGLEIQTCILEGRTGEEACVDVMQNVSKAGGYVDHTCGMHVHLDMSAHKEDVETLKRLLVFHLVFEDVLHSVLPPERRGNRYCRSLVGEYSIPEVQAANSIEQLEQIWYKNSDRETIEAYKGQRYQDTRYRGINYHSLLSGGHVEIRYHSGTLNSRKALEWVNLHCRIVDLCAGVLDNPYTLSKTEDAEYGKAIERLASINLKLGELQERAGRFPHEITEIRIMARPLHEEQEQLERYIRRIGSRTATMRMSPLNAPVQPPTIDEIVAAGAKAQTLFGKTKVMYQLLKLEPSSVRYLNKRQKKFKKATRENELSIDTLVSKQDQPIESYGEATIPNAYASYGLDLTATPDQPMTITQERLDQLSRQLRHNNAFTGNYFTGSNVDESPATAQWIETHLTSDDNE